ncbi:MAG: hypothetical protein WCH57_07575 [Verrucomicrobiota bacterium]
MKQRTQWIAALFTAASASLAMAGPGSGLYGPYGSEGFGPYSQRVIRLEPVGECNACNLQQPVVIKRTSCVMESSPGVVWSEPSNPAEALGNVIAAPFRLIGSGLAWTGRTLSGQPEIVSSREYLEPVGERVTTVTTKTIKHTKCGKKVMLKKVTYLSQPQLMPVGERFVTIRTFRSQPLLEPVGERFTTIRTFRSQPLLEPVGERFTTVKVIHHKRMLAPVGERITTVKVIHHKRLLLPVGERTWIRTTRVMKSSCGCD